MWKHWKWRLAQYLELAWWKRYLRRWDAGQYSEAKKVYWQRVLSAAGIALAPGEHVLDAGCGPAGIFIALPHQQVDAVDPLLAHYEQYLPVFQSANYPHVRFWPQPLEDFRPTLPYRHVFCLNAINHVRDIRHSMQVLCDALAPGGALVLSVDAHRYSWCCRLFRLLPGDVLHPHQYTATEYVQMLETHGLCIERQEILKTELIFAHYLYVARKPIP